MNHSLPPTTTIITRHLDLSLLSVNSSFLAADLDKEKETESSQLQVPAQISSVQDAVLGVDAGVQWTPAGIQTAPYINMKYWYGSSTL